MSDSTMNIQPEKYNILLVDDDKAIVDVFKYALGEEGYNVYPALCASEAMQVAETTSINFLITDIQLPDQDGLALSSMIKERYPDIIIILMTGYPGISTAIKGLRENIHDYLIKPFSIEQVISSIERALNNKKLHQSSTENLIKIKMLEQENANLHRKLAILTSEQKSGKEKSRDKTLDHAHKTYQEQQ